jgi:hypothetical protein
VREDADGGAERALSDADCAGLRNQARAWLKAELAAWSKLLEAASAERRQVIAETLRLWQQDTGLADVRDEIAVGRLPEDESGRLRALGAEVAALLAKAGKP